MKSSGIQGLDLRVVCNAAYEYGKLLTSCDWRNGAGVLIGMLDDGFNNYRTHAALKKHSSHCST